MLQRWQAVGSIVFDLTGPRLQHQTSTSTEKRVAAQRDGRLFCFHAKLFFIAYAAKPFKCNKKFISSKLLIKEILKFCFSNKHLISVSKSLFFFISTSLSIH